MKKLVTHNGGFHADDVVAYAILQLVLDKRGETYELIRTREDDIISSADIVFDVGNIYDPVTHRYDHHQVGRAGSRENGIHYAAAGLVWKHFGRELCESEQVWSDIDKNIISPTDAADNGQKIVKEFAFIDVGLGSFTSFIGAFDTVSSEENNPENSYNTFIEISTITANLLKRYIESQNNLEKVYTEVCELYEKSPEKNILVIDKNIPRRVIIRMSEFSDLLFIIYPDGERTMWKSEVIRKNSETFEARVPFPPHWAGLRDTELQEVCGVSDALFAHPGQFLIGARSLQGVQQMVAQALEYYEQNQ
jgi:uncharacterized UPF0160 family protein